MEYAIQDKEENAMEKINMLICPQCEEILEIIESDDEDIMFGCKNDCRDDGGGRIKRDEIVEYTDKISWYRTDERRNVGVKK